MTAALWPERPASTCRGSAQSTGSHSSGTHTGRAPTAEHSAQAGGKHNFRPIPPQTGNPVHAKCCRHGRVPARERACPLAGLSHCMRDMYTLTTSCWTKYITWLCLSKQEESRRKEPCEEGLECKSDGARSRGTVTGKCKGRETGLRFWSRKMFLVFGVAGN